MVADNLSTVRIGDLSVHDVTFPAAIEAIVKWGRERSGGYVCTPNVDHVVQARRNLHFRAAINRGRLRVPDGMWIVYASRIAGRPLQGTVTGRLLVEPVCGELWRRSEPVVFFGAGSGAAQRAMEVVGKTLGLTPVGTAISPEMGLEIGSDADRVHVSSIQAIDPAVVFVGLGAPKQELWMAHHAEDLPRTTMVGVGAAFDILSGRYREAPRWMTRVGFEWLFRLAQEPRRLARRYLIDDPSILVWAIRMRLHRR